VALSLLPRDEALGLAVVAGVALHETPVRVDCRRYLGGPLQYEIAHVPHGLPASLGEHHVGVEFLEQDALSFLPVDL